MTQSKQKKLGIIAGSGVLPTHLIQFCRETNYPFFVIALKNHADPLLLPDDCEIEWVRVGAVGKVYQLLKSHGVTEIVMIGGVRRPSILEIWPDWMGWQLISRVGLMQKGDDGLLRHIIFEIETLGFKVCGIHELMPELLAPAGVWTAQKPTQTDQTDIARGCLTAQLLGLADVGQSVVVQKGLVLAVEGIEGTKALIERAKLLRRRGRGGVLVKMKKPQQEMRVDMPTIGVETVQSVYDSGLRGIAVEAGKVLVSDIESVIRLADKLGVFIVGVKSEDFFSPSMQLSFQQLAKEVSLKDENYRRDG